jgi:hypothetical protein
LSHSLGISSGRDEFFGILQLLNSDSCPFAPVIYPPIRSAQAPTQNEEFRFRPFLLHSAAG